MTEPPKIAQIMIGMENAPPRTLSITICPAPEGATPLHPDPDHGCLCSIANGRCEKHSAMMKEIRAVWDSGSDDGPDVLRSLADGYGYPGSMIEMDTYDWSGIRDSSEASVENMWKAIHA